MGGDINISLDCGGFTVEVNLVVFYMCEFVERGFQ